MLASGQSVTLDHWIVISWRRRILLLYLFPCYAYFSAVPVLAYVLTYLACLLQEAAS